IYLYFRQIVSLYIPIKIAKELTTKQTVRGSADVTKRKTQTTSHGRYERKEIRNYTARDLTSRKLQMSPQASARVFSVFHRSSSCDRVAMATHEPTSPGRRPAVFLGMWLSDTSSIVLTTSKTE